MQKLVWEITGCWRINMKIYLNKNIREIHWSVYVSTAICFICTYFIYIEYKEIKFLFEKGDVEKAVVIKLPTNCYSSSRVRIYLELKLVAKEKIASLQINEKICDTIHLNDIILVRCTNEFKRILKYDPLIKKAPKKDLYSSIFSFCVGLFFLAFGNTKNNYFF
jgi:hypothetical protein